ncbi:MAG TPA: hypothetical protein VF743_00385, partial [Acidimicrobiales bacterium]
CRVVVTRCSGAHVHRERVEGRRRDIPGWYELDWDHVAVVLSRWTAPHPVDLHLDAADPLEANAARLAALLAGSSAPPPSPSPSPATGAAG